MDAMNTISSASAQREWTVLLYMDGNNGDIERDVFTSFLTLEEVSGGPDMALVAELGRRPRPSSLPSEERVPPGDMNEHWESVRRYELDKGPPPPKWGARRVYTSLGEHDGDIDSRLLADHGPQDMSDPGRLKDFLAWGMRAYPAKRVMVVLANHGAGFLGTLSDEKSRRTMALPEVQKALAEASEETGVKPDVLVMDACLMAQAEAAWQLRDAADYYVASEEINWNSYPLAKALRGMPPGAAPEEMAGTLVAECGKAPHEFPATSALDLRRMGECTASVKALADRLLEAEPAVIRDLIGRATAFGAGDSRIKPYSDYRDLGSFARLLAGDARLDARLREAAQGVLSALEATVTHRAGKGEGLGVYLPLTGFDYTSYREWKFPEHTDRRQYEALYRGLDFARETGWDRVIDRFATPSAH